MGNIRSSSSASSGVAQPNYTSYYHPSSYRQHHKTEDEEQYPPIDYSSTDTLFCFGNNAKGQLGLGDELVQSHLRGVFPSRFPQVASGMDIHLVATGGYFTILATGSRNQQLFVAGENNYGQLLIDPKKASKLTQWTEVDASHHGHPWLYEHGVKTMGCGRAFTVLVTNHNRVVAFGCNYSGQLGLDESSSSGDVASSRFECSEPVGDGSVNIVKVACGTEHSLLLTSDGRVMCAGSMRYSAVRLGDNVPGYGGWRWFQKFDSGVPFVTDIACGLFFSCFLVENTDVYLFGFNRGIGTMYEEPTRIFRASDVGSQGIKCLACAGRTIVVLTEESELYMCGEMMHGYDAKQEMTHISYASLGIPPIDIRQIACGESHLLLTTAENQVYVSGDDSFGQLGESVKRSKSGVLAGPLVQFNDEVARDRRQIAQISCGAYFSVIMLRNVVRNGRLWQICQRQQLTDVVIITQQ